MRDATAFPCFSVFVWTGEIDSNKLRKDAYFFRKRRRKISGYEWTRPYWLFRSLRATRNNRIIVPPCLLALLSFPSSYATQKTSVLIGYATLHYYTVKFLTIKFMTDVNTEPFCLAFLNLDTVLFSEWEESHWSLKVRNYFWRDVFVTVLLIN